MNDKLIGKCYHYDFAKLLNKKGYAFFTKGEYNLNIIGIRANKNNRVTNEFDDAIVVDYDTPNGHKRQVWSITTEPGRYYMKNIINPKGTAILIPNQYRGCWKLGYHKNRYKALIQSKPLSVYRDNNKDDIYDLSPETTDKGLFGINIHRSNDKITRQTIDMYSAGCQVFNNPKEFASFIRLCEEQVKRFGNSFTYTLINEEDM